MCKYSDDTGYECPHKRLEDSDYCIFHLQNDNKDVDEFDKGIKEIFETDEDLIDLNGFYFPPESSDFSGQHFQKKMSFMNAIFSGTANFWGAQFSAYVSFVETIFLANGIFHETEFWGDVQFSSAKFSGDVVFRGAEFSEMGNFGNAKFLDYASFASAKFLDYASFYGANFSNDVNFKGTRFPDGTNFREVNFSGDVDYTSAEFLGHTTFLSAIFSGDANFKFTVFSGDAIFEYAKFSGDVIFVPVEFLGLANFKGTELTGKFDFIPDKCETIVFENTYFSDNVRIKADMSKCSFANSNVERVDMTDSTWIVDNKPKDSYKIWEQRQGELSSNWKELEGIYRRLKQSYQRFGDNDTAGNFYYHEMECKRQQLKGAKKLFWDVFYKLLCGYGEKPFNVIWASISIIFAASLFFFYWGIELLGSEVLNLTPRLINYDLSLNFQWVITNFGKVFNDWLECLYTSVITFTTLGYGDVHPIGFSRIVASVEAGIGIIMTALFIFVFTRKMLR